MTESIITDFHKWTQTHSYLWNDDPRGFITSYREKVFPTLAENEAIQKVWSEATDEEIAFAEAHFDSLLEAIPPRPQGELVYVMSFLGDEEVGGHVTLLGPTLFRDHEAIEEFMAAAQDFVADTNKLKLEIGETITVTSHSGFEREVHLVRSCIELDIVHRGLVGLAELYGGRLMEPDFSKDGFMAHLTHLPDCELEDDDLIELKRVAVSLHPGARINVRHAVNLDSFSFAS